MINTIFIVKCVYSVLRVEGKVEDGSIKKQIDQAKNDREKYQVYLRELEGRIAGYENEHKIITKSMAKFAHFLKHNSIIPVNDAYAKYIAYLIEK